jgi:hypothetical protein
MDSYRRWRAIDGWLFLACVFFVLSCGRDPRTTRALCRDDSACESGMLCENFQCVPAATKACDVVIDGNPILQPAPHVVAFGELDVAQATQKVAVHNLGNCTLTLFEASLQKKGKTPFRCELCEGRFPIEIFPGRSKEIPIAFQAEDVGTFDDTLMILSDDKEYGELHIPVHANFRGVPELRVAPNPVDFGYVAHGRASQRQIQITNQGTGVAAVTVNSVTLAPSDTPHYELGQVPGVSVLRPVAADPDAILSLDLHYHPRTLGQHPAELVLQTSKGEVRVPLMGNSETPPKLTVSPPSIDLGKVPLGKTFSLPLTLVNEGGAALSVNYAWGGPKPSTDLFAVPHVPPAIQPGQYLELQVAVTAATLGPVNGLLLLTTNDPSKPAITIPVSAEGVAGPGPEVVKLEMVYDNGTDNVFDQDLRNVDLTLEHPYGYVCNKADPKPTSWGAYGSPSWVSFAPKEEPERIILADASRDGTYRVMVQYLEDCSALPTQLLAGLVGISVDALIAYLSGGIINVGGKDIGKLIEQVCVNRSASNAVVRAYVNGTLMMEKTVTLEKKGDMRYAFDLIRANGTFSAR